MKHLKWLTNQNSINIMTAAEESIQPWMLEQGFSITAPERFWSKVNKIGPIPPHVPELGRCWQWTGGLDSYGYGHFNKGPRGASPIAASRFAWSVYNGLPQKGIWVLHKCDNRKCCNPCHLFLGTQTDNMRDCANKGRLRLQKNPEHARRGSNHPMSKLTEEKVIEIRRRYSSGEMQSDIYRAFNVSPMTVNLIVHGKIWVHI